MAINPITGYEAGSLQDQQMLAFLQQAGYEGGATVVAGGGGGDSSSLLGLNLTPDESAQLAQFLGLDPALAQNPALLAEIMGLGGYNARIAHLASISGTGAAALSAQASMLAAQAQAAHYRAADALAKGQLELARQHEANAVRLEEQKQVLDRQIADQTAQMDYAKGLMGLAQKPEDAYRYQFERYGLQAPSGSGVTPLPVPDVVAKLFAQAQGGQAQASPSTLNPALASLIPGATLNPQGQSVSGQQQQGGTGQQLTLPPYLQNLFAQAGHPTAGIPIGQNAPPGSYPSVGTPSAQSLRYLSPDQRANLEGYQRDVAGVTPGAFTADIDRLSPQSGGLAVPGASGYGDSTSQQTPEAFGLGGLVTRRSHPLLAERGIPEQVTPRPDLRALMGGPNIHGPLPPSLAMPGGAPGLAGRSPQPAGAPLPGMPGSPAVAAGMPQMSGAPGGMIPPPPGPQASLGFPPLPPMNAGMASMQMPTSRELGPNPTQPIMPKVAVPEGPLGPGSAGPNVTALQRALERLGYFQLPFGANYGNYQGNTTAAVARFQQDHGHLPTNQGHHDKRTAQMIRERLQGYARQPHGPNPLEMRGGDTPHALPMPAAMTGSRPTMQPGY